MASKINCFTIYIVSHLAGIALKSHTVAIYGGMWFCFERFFVLCEAKAWGWGGCTAECWSLLNVQAQVGNRSLPALREGLSPTLVQFCLQDVRKIIVFPVTCALVRFWWCCQVLLFTSWVAMCSDSTLLLPVLVSFSFHFLSTPDLLDLRVWWVFKPCASFCLTGPCVLPNFCLSFVVVVLKWLNALAEVIRMDVRFTPDPFCCRFVYSLVNTSYLMFLFQSHWRANLQPKQPLLS